MQISRSVLRNVDEAQFRAICQNDLKGLIEKAQPEMLNERRARAQECRLVPETIAGSYWNLRTMYHSRSNPYHLFRILSIQPGLLNSPTLRKPADWKLAPLATNYPRLSTDRDTAEKNNLEWITPGHPLFEALRRHTVGLSRSPSRRGRAFTLYNTPPLPVRLLPGSRSGCLGQVIHECPSPVELTTDGRCIFQESSLLGNFLPAPLRASAGRYPSNCRQSPQVASLPEATAWLNEHPPMPFLEEVRHNAFPKSNALRTMLNCH